MFVQIVKNITPTGAKKFANIVYYNFINLSKYKDLQHTEKEIERLIIDPKSLILLMIDNKKIAGYMLAETKQLNDGRLVLYINYILTSKRYRNKGVATKLMSFGEKYSKHKGCDGILLTCDVENEYVNNFYLMKGFMPDMHLRRYHKYDVMYKSL